MFEKLRSWQGSLQTSPSAALAGLHFQGISELFCLFSGKKQGKKREKAQAELGNLHSWLREGYLLLFLAQEQFQGCEFGCIHRGFSAPQRLLLYQRGQSLPAPILLCWRGDLIICATWGPNQVDAFNTQAIKSFSMYSEELMCLLPLKAL